jgi:hypothetical protein
MKRRQNLLESYFGLIEALFVFGLAIAFYIWQRRDLNRYKEQDRKTDRDTPDKH